MMSGLGSIRLVRPADPLADPELGGAVSVFRGRVTPWQGILVLFLGAIVGVAAGHYSGSRPVGWILGVLAGLALLIATWRRARRTRVNVYAEGLTFRHGQRDEKWRWRDTDIRVVARPLEVQGQGQNALQFLLTSVVIAMVKGLLPRSMKYRIDYQLTGTEGQLTFDATVKDYKRLGELVENLITSCRLPELLESVRAGEAVTFGGFRVEQHGLTDKLSQPPRLIPWDAPPSIALSPYRVSVRTPSSKRTWASTERKLVPNARLLAAMVERLVVTPRDADGQNRESSRGR
jgi:hypothetical protein